MGKLDITPDLVSRINKQLVDTMPSSYLITIQGINQHGRGVVVNYADKAPGRAIEYRSAGFVLHSDGNLQCRYDMII